MNREYVHSVVVNAQSSISTNQGKCPTETL